MSITAWHACGIRLDGSVVCWGGDNRHGEASPPEGRFTRIASGAGHSCGIRDAGDLVCWGQAPQERPQTDSGPFASVSVGSYRDCATYQRGGSVCWALGEPPKSFPEMTLEAGGDDKVCGLGSDGTASCFDPFLKTEPTVGGQADRPRDPLLYGPYLQLGSPLWLSMAVGLQTRICSECTFGLAGVVEPGIGGIKASVGPTWGERGNTRSSFNVFGLSAVYVRTWGIPLFAGPNRHHVGAEAGLTILDSSDDQRSAMFRLAAGYCYGPAPDGPQHIVMLSAGISLEFVFGFAKFLSSRPM